MQTREDALERQSASGGVPRTMVCFPVIGLPQITSKAGGFRSGEDHAAGFLGKMQPDLGGDLSVRHFVSRFHVERAPAWFFGIEAFFEFALRLARPEQKKRRCLTNQGNDPVVVGVQLLGKLPVHNIIRLRALGGVRLGRMDAITAAALFVGVGLDFQNVVPRSSASDDDSPAVINPNSN